MKISAEGMATWLAPVAACSALMCSPTATPAVTSIQFVEEPSPIVPVRRSVVLIAIDGVRWQEVFEGVDPILADRNGLPESARGSAETLVPNISRLAREGAAVGAPGGGPSMVASGPNFVSMPGYTEMLSGRSETGCRDNGCARTRTPTIVDDVVRAGLGRPAVVTSWPDIERAAAAFPENVDMSVGRHGGPGREAFRSDPVLEALLEAGESAGPDPGADDFRSDAHTAALALAYFKTKHPTFLFVGLGETDEFAHRNDYAGYLNALRRADETVGHFADIALRATNPNAGVTLFVTTDHGRSATFASHGGQPESARVWLVAGGAGVPSKGPTRSPETRRLANIASTVGVVLGIPPRGDAEGPLAELFEPAAPRGDRRAQN